MFFLNYRSCFKRTFSATKYVYMIALIIAVPRAGESKVVDSRDDDVEMFLVSNSQWTKNGKIMQLLKLKARWIGDM